MNGEKQGKLCVTCVLRARGFIFDIFRLFRDFYLSRFRV